MRLKDGGDAGYIHVQCVNACVSFLSTICGSIAGRIEVEERVHSS